MSTQLDSSIGFKKETTYGTPAPVDRFYEFLSEDFAWNPTFAQSDGQRYGQRMARADRRVLTKEEVGGSLTVEMFAKGLGLLFEAALGAASSSQIAAGPGYQQLFTPAINDFLPSYTIQKGVPLLGGAVSAQTFAGMLCSGFELTIPNGGVPQIKFNFAGRGVDTSTAYAIPSYLASNQLYSSLVHASIAVGGTIVLPTATALGSGGTAGVDVRDFNLTYDNAIDSNGFFIGGLGKRGRRQALGKRAGSGTMTVEYDTNVLRDAYLSQADLALILTLQLPVAITGAVFPTFQVVIPNIRLEGELPKVNGGDVVTQSVGYTVLDNGAAAQPIYVAIVTPETAI